MVTKERVTPLSANAATLERELDWFTNVLQTRINLYLARDSRWPSIRAIEPPELSQDESIYSTFVQHYEMAFEERLVVLLALAPHIRPQLLDGFFLSNEDLQRGRTEFGGIQGRMHGGFLPTGETALFLVAGSDLERRLLGQHLFDRDHFFALHNIVKLETAPLGEPVLSGQLVLSREIVDFLTRGELRKPDYSQEFPAKLVTSEMEWDELVLASSTVEQLRELHAWIRHSDTLMSSWALGRRLLPGYKSLFYGPPGTGKTITATLLGKRVGRDVYRIALSTVVSKYIGETEKNLERIFDRAENMDCILFFDEADALFGKRTSVSDAHDRYANQEVSYLLQRIEEFGGIVILASNFRSNLDDAFMRRFQAVVHFPMPNAGERKRLWAGAFSAESQLENPGLLDEISEKYELSGGAILNAVRYASLMAIEAESNVIKRGDLLKGIRRELQKEGKTL